MSLKYFHIFFITLSVILSWGTAAFEFQNYSGDKNLLNLGISVFAFAVGIGLLVYGAWFLRKTSKLIL